MPGGMIKLPQYACDALALFKIRRFAPVAVTASALVLVLVGCAAIPETTTLRPSDIGLVKLLQPIRPPIHRATRESDVDRIALAASSKRGLNRLVNRRSTKAVLGVQTPFFFESDLGRTYLKSTEPRALAFGDPAQECPAIGAALSADTAAKAAHMALRRCLKQLGGRPNCGCRIAAIESLLLADVAHFEHARAVSVMARFGNGPIAQLIGETTRTEPQDGPVRITHEAIKNALATQSITLHAISGLIGRIDFAYDGSAYFESAGGAKYHGYWRSEGFRRGWFARIVALTPRKEKGDPFLLLVGYEPREFAARQHDLFRQARSILK